MIRLFLVKVDVPDGITIAEMRDYIENAVQTWYGQMDPDSDFFLKFDSESVKVKRVQQGDILK
jgi:hypothetical protein